MAQSLPLQHQLGRSIAPEPYRQRLLHQLSHTPTGTYRGLERDLQRWQSYVDSQLGGPCLDHISKWRQALGLPGPTDLDSCYGFLIDVLEAVEQIPVPSNITLDSIAAKVCENHQQDVHIGEANDAHQAVLAMVGCLTMLYSWRKPDSRNEIIVEAPSAQPARRVALAVAPHVQRSIGKLLGSFGGLLLPYQQTDRLLYASKLNLATLSLIGKVKIDLVNHISAHLSFNPVRRRLSIFAHPAYCALRCGESCHSGALNR